jgi:hypothetical protein
VGMLHLMFIIWRCMTQMQFRNACKMRGIVWKQPTDISATLCRRLQSHHNAVVNVHQFAEVVPVKSRLKLELDILIVHLYLLECSRLL